MERMHSTKLTIIAATDDSVKCNDKVCEYLVHFMETCENCDDVGARIGVLFGQYAS